MYEPNAVKIKTSRYTFMRLTHFRFIYIKNAQSRIFESQGYLRTETAKELYDLIEPKTKSHHKQHLKFKYNEFSKTS